MRLSLFVLVFFAQKYIYLHTDIYVQLSIMIEFVLMVNKQGQTRLSSYYSWLSMEERTALESEVIRKCLSRNELQCSFMEHRQYRVIYRRYASLYFIVGVDSGQENELAILEFIHALVETFDKYFGEYVILER